MEAKKVRNVLTLILLICLLFILIIFCIVYIWNVKSPSVQQFGQPEARDYVQNTSIIDNLGSLMDLNHSHEHEEHRMDDEDTPSAPETDDYKIKFSGKEHGPTGKVLIEHNGTTGFVCSDDFDNADAAVVCREMGFKKGRAYTLLMSSPYSQYINLAPMVSMLDCTGVEARLKDCKGFSLHNVTPCTWSAAALCYDDVPYEMRLVKGMMPNTGMVEMKVGGEWGIVCAFESSNDAVADVLCRSMNFTGGFALEPRLLGGSPRSKVWVPYVSCPKDGKIRNSILDCFLILNPEDIIIDYIEHRNNRYKNIFMDCLHKTNSSAAAVQCLT